MTCDDDASARGRNLAEDDSKARKSPVSEISDSVLAKELVDFTPENNTRQQPVRVLLTDFRFPNHDIMTAERAYGS